MLVEKVYGSQMIFSTLFEGFHFQTNCKKKQYYLQLRSGLKKTLYKNVVDCYK